MRIYTNCYELMSETGRNLWEMGLIVKPKTYQNKDIENNPEFETKELICEQYCLTSLKDEEYLFKYSNSKDWADAEFKERITPNVNPGEAWKLRKDIWEQFLVDGSFDYSYSERLTGPLSEVIELLREDPDTRKAVIPIFNGNGYIDTDYYNDFVRIPCSMYYDFLIRENEIGEKQLNICYHQRSSDFITHFGNDVYLAYRLMQYVAAQIGVKPGYLIHTIDSLHVYRKDWQKLKNSIGQ